MSVKEPFFENEEIVIAYLSDFAFDTFEHDNGIVKAFGPEPDLINEMEEIENAISEFIIKSPVVEMIEKENWNRKWEENYFDPVVIDNKIRIRAAFHKKMPDFQHDIVIQPKMSFGTGHHSTTRLMISLMLSNSNMLTDKFVLDMGAGTGVLAIVAEKLGADQIYAIDIEDWAVENVIENAEINGCKRITSILGDASRLLQCDVEFDVILANIQREVLIQDCRFYLEKLKSGGHLLLSGFYQQDLEAIKKVYSPACEYLESEVDNNWCAAHFQKIQ